MIWRYCMAVALSLLLFSGSAFADSKGSVSVPSNKPNEASIPLPYKPVSEVFVSYAPLVEQLMPAVVSITATKKQKDKRTNVPNYFSFKDFRDLMENLQPFLDNRGTAQPKERNVFLFGSGFVVDPHGIIVTNNHVIEGTDEVTVKFNDDTTAQAKVLGRDQLTDIAVLKVDLRRPLAYVKFGNSDDVRIGDGVLAIGSPIGLGGTVSAGIVSALSRDIHSGPYDDFLQTDASLNQGSSGGPLFNLKGEVIGINTAIYSTSGGGNIGIGFAIPANSAIPIVEILKTKSHVKRGYLGVTVQEITPEIAQSMGNDDIKGVIVSSVIKGGPADSGGLKVGDVVLEFNGRPVAKVREFSKTVAYFPIGRKSIIKVMRKGETVVLTVKVGELNTEKTNTENVEEGDEKEESSDAMSLLGVRIRSITPELRQSYGLSSDVSGVVVLSVDAGSNAESKGIRRDDIINQVNQQDIATTEDFKREIDSAVSQKRHSVLLRIMRRGQAVFVPVSLDG